MEQIEFHMVIPFFHRDIFPGIDGAPFRESLASPVLLPAVPGSEFDDPFFQVKIGFPKALLGVRQRHGRRGRTVITGNGRADDPNLIVKKPYPGLVLANQFDNRSSISQGICKLYGGYLLPVCLQGPQSSPDPVPG